MNNDVLALGSPGFGAREAGEWIEGLDRLLTNAYLRRACGAEGRRIVEAHYSVEIVAAALALCLEELLEG
jgi:hypothetical protein